MITGVLYFPLPCSLGKTRRLNGGRNQRNDQPPQPQLALEQVSGRVFPPGEKNVIEKVWASFMSITSNLQCQSWEIIFIREARGIHGDKANKMCAALPFPIMLLLLLLSRFSRVWLCATHRRQPTRLPCPWDSPGKNTGVGCHFLL